MDPDVLHLNVDQGLDMPFPDPSAPQQTPEATVAMGGGLSTPQQCSIECHVDYAVSADTCRLGR